MNEQAVNSMNSSTAYSMGETTSYIKSISCKMGKPPLSVGERNLCEPRIVGQLFYKSCHHSNGQLCIHEMSEATGKWSIHCQPKLLCEQNENKRNQWIVLFDKCRGIFNQEKVVQIAERLFGNLTIKV